MSDKPPGISIGSRLIDLPGEIDPDAPPDPEPVPSVKGVFELDTSDYPKPNPVCVACGKEMTCVRNGTIVENGSVQWRGDQYQCPKCSIAIVATFGDGEDLTGIRDYRMIHVDNL